MVPSLGDYRRFFIELVSGERARHEFRIAATRDRIAAGYLDYSQPLRILDLANGRLRPQFQILRRAGHFVVGADLANRSQPGWTEPVYRLARWIYRMHVPDHKGRTGMPALLCADVARLPFGSGAFDLVTSVAAFEHFLDVPAVVRELYRVVRPGGVVFCLIHLFTCPSGGHNVQLMGLPIRRLPRGVQAWDHLRRRRLPFHVPLNEWRIDQYLREFAGTFNILESYCYTREGEHLLSPEIEAELADYSIDELTCHSYIILAGK